MSLGGCRCQVLQHYSRIQTSRIGRQSTTQLYYSTFDGTLENEKSDSTSVVEKAKLKLHAKRNRLKNPLAKSTSQQLSEKSREVAVPASRVSRIINYGTLVAGLGIGAINQGVKKQLGLVEDVNGSVLMSEDNIERIVTTLCKVRGAALKLGQMLSIQDDSFMPEQLQKAFDRVRSNADFMPKWQLEQVMEQELTSNWRDLFKEFNMKPFAAASIGQVHQGVTLDGRTVAVKIQYPGVAESIDSDIDSLLSILVVSNLLPEGLFLEQAAAVARRELAWEVDYVREAESSTRFKNLLRDNDNYFIPDYIPNLSTNRILATELIQGVPLDDVVHMDQETRNNVSLWVLELVLKELFEFNFMQTDPNWSNFLYNKETERICLLDFGASRGYTKTFIDAYIEVIHGAATGNREKVEKGLTVLGFQTGYEAKAFINANVDAVMILGEPFSKDAPYDFAEQDITEKIKRIIPVMLSHRLSPPPEESYSLHRKLSGAFLLATKLDAKINCFNAFHSIYDAYKFD